MSVVDFHQPWSAPWNDSTIAVEDVEGAFPAPVSIDGHRYIIDLLQYQRNTLGQYRQQSDTSREPGEQSLAIEGVWKRTGTSSFMGAGQEYYDDDDSDRRRFFQSRGIDPWTRRCVQLLPSTVQVRESSTLNQFLINVDGHIILIDGDEAYESDDPLDPSEPWNALNLGATVDVTAVTTDGTTLYAACAGGGIRKLTPGSGGASLTVGIPAQFVLYANGWIVASQGPHLVSVAVDGTVTDIGEPHQNPNFDYVCGTSAPNAIYLGGNAGEKAEIYRTAVDDAGAALTAPVFAGDLPPGEIIYALESYGTVILIGTSKGLRVASVQSSGALSIGAVIEDPSGQGVRCFDGRGEFVWFGYVNPLGNRRGLGRANLSRNTEESVPAYAADLESDEGSGHTVGVATWVVGNQDYRLFTISGSGVWAQTEELVDEGTLDLGYLGQGSPEAKTLQSVSVSHQSLQGSIEVVLENDRGQSVSAEQAQQATYQSGEMARSLSGELIKVKLVLRPLEDLTAGPCVRRWTMRVVPAPAGVDEIIVPILLSDVAGDEDQWRLPLDTFAEFRYLKVLENNRTVVDYREGQATYQVTIREVGLKGAVEWSHRRRFFNATLLVRMITVEGVPPRLGGI